MKGRPTALDTKRQTLSRDKFLSWVDEDRTTALVSEDHGQFYADCFEFGVAASAATQDEAIEKAQRLLMRYLVVCCVEGRTYADAKKPPPARIRIRLLYLSVRERALGGIKPSLSRLGGLISVPTADSDAQIPVI